MFVITTDNLDLPNTVPLATWQIRHPAESALFGKVVQKDTDKFVLYRNNGVEFMRLMEIATFPTMESLQRSLSNIEGLEYERI